MLKKTITYVDYNDVERKEDFYFNLTKSEIVDMEGSYDGGLSNMLRRVVDAKEGSKIIKIFKEIILKAYGEKSDDGKRFMKSPELSEAFSQTAAYDQLYMELATDAKAAADFINSIVPADIRDAIKDSPELKVLETSN